MSIPWCCDRKLQPESFLRIEWFSINKQINKYDWFLVPESDRFKIKVLATTEGLLVPNPTVDGNQKQEEGEKRGQRGDAQGVRGKSTRAMLALSIHSWTPLRAPPTP